jgi:hypothetical protein
MTSSYDSFSKITSWTYFVVSEAIVRLLELDDRPEMPLPSPTIPALLHPANNRNRQTVRRLYVILVLLTLLLPHDKTRYARSLEIPSRGYRNAFWEIQAIDNFVDLFPARIRILNNCSVDAIRDEYILATVVGVVSNGVTPRRPE